MKTLKNRKVYRGPRGGLYVIKNTPQGRKKVHLSIDHPLRVNASPPAKTSPARRSRSLAKRPKSPAKRSSPNRSGSRKFTDPLTAAQVDAQLPSTLAQERYTVVPI